MQRLDLGLHDAWSLALPYWQSGERWRARGLLGALVALNLVLVGTTVLFTYWQGAFYNALAAKDWHGFLGSLLWWHSAPKDGWTLGFAPILAIFVVASAYELYLRQALQIRWRRWMTHTLVGDWLSDRAYFRMALTDSGTDNPDQRIAEDIRLFVDNTISLGLGLMRSAVALLSFVLLLWTLSAPIVLMGVTIHGYLVWVALIYAAVGTSVAHLVGRRLTPLHYVQQKAEADFRFSLMRLFDNAEGIAFHGGEAEQERELSHRFAALVANWRGIMTVTLRLTFLTSSYAQTVLVFPLAVVAPAYFAGRMPLGGIFQTANAFVQVQNALSWIVQSYSDLTGWLATVQRLAGFRRSVAQMRVATDGPVVTADGRDQLELSGLNLALPNGRSLLHGIELRIARGERLLIRGPSGAGKSTLLRAIVGIWPFGSGTIRRAAGRQLFMPQRPYMPLGTLKHAVCYPLSETTFADGEVTAALHDAGLGHLASEIATTDVWEHRLSGGEQQRLTLARALLIRPDWLFLDEATSALDPEAEADVYSLLHERLPRTTLVSIAHRPEIARFHTRILYIRDGVLRAEEV
jgi:vitamin B12/bleomycin/antimicrobial peptide transport system ATP-binding/permease protein